MNVAEYLGGIIDPDFDDAGFTLDANGTVYSDQEYGDPPEYLRILARWATTPPKPGLLPNPEPAQPSVWEPPKIEQQAPQQFDGQFSRDGLYRNLVRLYRELAEQESC